MMDTTTTASRMNAGAAAGRGGSLLAAWREALAGWVGSAGPAEPVRLLRADGTETVWVGEREVAATGREPRFTAVELPEDLVLRLALDLPLLQPADTEEALLLQARSHSPFAADDMVWGFRLGPAATSRRAEIAIASRQQVQELIRERWPALVAASQAPEVWAPGATGVPVVLRGFGEGLRLERAARNRRLDGILLAVALVLALAAAATPTLQLRSRAIEAVEAYEALARRAAPLVARRDELARINDRLRAADAAASDRVDPAAVMEHLTRVLPDDTHLLSLDVRKAKISATGHTADASALLQRLSADPRMKDVRAPTAVTRVPGAAKEVFTLEFTMDTQAPSSSTPDAGAMPPIAAAPPAVPASASAVTAASANGGPAPSPAPAAPVAAPPAAAAPAAAGAAVKPSAAPASGGSPFAIGGSRR